MAHELECFFQDLTKAVLDVACQVLLDILVQTDDANGLGDVDDILLVPDRHGRQCEMRVAPSESWSLLGSESRVVATDGAVVEMLRLLTGADVG